ncbi:hypothetical protein CLI64_11080 [Nostoc sp. CENA543]|nr:hypothetical protein CLI64_11080 [Nostoc sp. CENA543]
MAYLSQDEIERIELVCGYAQFSTLTRSQLELEHTQAVIDRALAILGELDTIDQQLVDVRADNYVAESRGTKLNYSYHTRQLKLSGYNLVRELSSILGIGVARDRYFPHANKTHSYW